MAKRLILIAAVVACACPSKPTTQALGSGSAVEPGSGSGSGSAVIAKSCTELRPRLEQMYRAEAQANEPKHVEEAVADNTAMVLNDCAKAPDKVVACINGVTTVAELEAKCVRPLDDEGTEGGELRK